MALYSMIEGPAVRYQPATFKHTLLANSLNILTITAVTYWVVFVPRIFDDGQSIRVISRKWPLYAIEILDYCEWKASSDFHNPTWIRNTTSPFSFRVFVSESIESCFLLASLKTRDDSDARRDGSFLDYCWRLDNIRGRRGCGNWLKRHYYLPSYTSCVNHNLTVRPGHIVWCQNVCLIIRLGATGNTV